MRASLALALAAVLTLSACGGDDGGRKTAATATSSTTTAPPGPASPDGAPGGGAPGPVTTPGAAPGPAAGGSGSSGGTASPRQTQGGNAAAPSGAGPKPATPGTYAYRQQGSATIGGSTRHVPPEGTVVVDPPSGNTQRHRRVVSPESSTETVYAFTDKALEVRSIRTRTSGPGGSYESECRFDPPLPAPTWPVRVGATFRGTAACGSFSLEVDGAVKQARSANVGGQTVEVFVLEWTTVTRGQVESNGRQVDWLAPSHQLRVRHESEQRGTIGVVPFESRLVAELQSLSPR